MTTDLSEPPVRLRSPADIVDAVPYLVGFQPEYSLVVISLRGSRRRLGVVARFDLASLWGEPECLEHAVRCIDHDGARSVILVFYPPGDGPSHSSVRPVAGALTRQFEVAGIEIAEVLCVGEQRWWSLCCERPDCCPPDGTPLERGRASQVAVATAVHGRVALASRRDVERTIAPSGGLAGAAMGYALPRARAALDDRVATGRGAEVVRETLELFEAAVRSRLSDERSLAAARPVDDAARLIVGLDDVSVRDVVITWAEGEFGAATRSLLAELVPRATPPFDVAPLTVLAWVAYLQGDGALAGIAVDRILDAGLDDGLVRVLDEALRAGLNPATFEPVMHQLRQAGPRDQE